MAGGPVFSLAGGMMQDPRLEIPKRIVEDVTKCIDAGGYGKFVDYGFALYSPRSRRMEKKQ